MSNVLEEIAKHCKANRKPLTDEERVALVGIIQKNTLDSMEKFLAHLRGDGPASSDRQILTNIGHKLH